MKKKTNIIIVFKKNNPRKCKLFSRVNVSLVSCLQNIFYEVNIYVFRFPAALSNYLAQGKEGLQDKSALAVSNGENAFSQNPWLNHQNWRDTKPKTFLPLRAY